MAARSGCLASKHIKARPLWCQTDTPTGAANCYFYPPPPLPHHIHTHTYTYTNTPTSNRITSHSTSTSEHFESGATLPPRGLGNRCDPPSQSAPLKQLCQPAAECPAPNQRPGWQTGGRCLFPNVETCKCSRMNKGIYTSAFTIKQAFCTDWKLNNEKNPWWMLELMKTHTHTYSRCILMIKICIYFQPFLHNPQMHLHHASPIIFVHPTDGNGRNRKHFLWPDYSPEKSLTLLLR